MSNVNAPFNARGGAFRVRFAIGGAIPRIADDCRTPNERRNLLNLVESNLARIPSDAVLSLPKRERNWTLRANRHNRHQRDDANCGAGNILLEHSRPVGLEWHEPDIRAERKRWNGCVQPWRSRSEESSTSKNGGDSCIYPSAYRIDYRKGLANELAITNYSKPTACLVQQPRQSTYPIKLWLLLFLQLQIAVAPRHHRAAEGVAEAETAAHFLEWETPTLLALCLQIRRYGWITWSLLISWRVRPFRRGIGIQP